MRVSTEPAPELLAEGHGITSPVPVLEVLDAAQTLDPAVDHDPQSGTQSFTLLHAVETPGDNCPHRPRGHHVKVKS